MNNPANDTPRTMIGEIPVYCAYDEIVDIEKVVPNPKNPNQHPEEQLKLLSKIIKGNGWRNAITVSKRSGFVVKGHGRLAAAGLLGAAAVPVEFQNYENEAAEHADMVADNRIAELAENSTTLLADILNELSKDEAGLDLTGYTEQDLEDIVASITEEQDAEPNDQDDEQEQPLPPMSKPGDLWLLGDHRLICGDATDAPTIERLMNGEKAAMVHTDPPYGVSYETQSGKFSMIKNDDKTHDELYYKLLLPAFNNYRKHTIEEAAFYIWHASSTRRDFEDAMTAAGLMECQYLIWVKNGISLGHADYQWSHEPCFYACRAGVSPKFYGDRAQHTVWRVTSCQNGAMMTVLGGGVVLTDGTGGKLCITDKPPKGKKMRYIRMEEGKPIDLFQEDRMQTVWEVARETNTLHPCLPAGQKVFFNDEWKNIEDVKVGDTNRYGSVVATTSHMAEKLVEISCGNDTVIATWNHPFLVAKEDGLYWINADQIRAGDRIVDVWEKSIRQQKKDTSGTDQTEREQEWSTTSSGKNTTEKSQTECKSIIEISKRQTTTFPIYNLSHPLNISGCTKVVSKEEMTGTSHATDAESTKNATTITGTFPEAGSTADSAKNATSKKWLKTEEGVLRTVGSVRNIEKPTKVYNLTMSDIPAFDTKIGLSHNTQKPVELPIRAIENSSQPGEIVLDFFGGSGSTLMGAELTGRRCYTTELDPVYCDVIISRYVTQTGNIGVTCIRDGEELNYIDLVRAWAKENGKEEEVANMKTPVVVIKKIVKAGEATQDEA